MHKFKMKFLSFPDATCSSSSFIDYMLCRQVLSGGVQIFFRVKILNNEKCELNLFVSGHHIVGTASHTMISMQLL